MTQSFCPPMTSELLAQLSSDTSLESGAQHGLHPVTALLHSCPQHQGHTVLGAHGAAWTALPYPVLPACEHMGCHCWCTTESQQLVKVIQTNPTLQDDLNLYIYLAKQTSRFSSKLGVSFYIWNLWPPWGLFFFLFTCLFNKYLGQARITFFQMPISFRDVLPSLLNFHGFTKAFFLQKSIFEWLTWYWKLLSLQQVLTSNICIFSSLSMWKHTPNQRNSSWFEALVLHIAEQKELADQQQADKTRECLPVGPESFWKSKCRSCPSYLRFQIPAATIHEDDRNVVYTA